MRLTLKVGPGANFAASCTGAAAGFCRRKGAWDLNDHPCDGKVRCSEWMEQSSFQDRSGEEPESHHVLRKL